MLLEFYQYTYYCIYNVYVMKNSIFLYLVFSLMVWNSIITQYMFFTWNF